MREYRDPGLSSLEQLRAGKLLRRMVQLVFGLVIFGVSMAMLVRSGLGAMPWDVFHQGIAKVLGWSFGQVVIATGLVVLLLWIPLRQWPGVGTILNAVLIGIAADVTLNLTTEPDPMWARVCLLAGGIVLNALAGALYIGSHLGTGPRDGLFMGLHRVTGQSVRLMRTGVEITVVVIGWLAGGVVGVGTVLYAVSSGPLLQLFLPYVQADLEVDPKGAKGAG